MPQRVGKSALLAQTLVGCSARGLLSLVLLIALAEPGMSAAEEPHRTGAIPIDRDLQTLVKETAARVRPAVVNLASTVFVRDRGFVDEGLPFGLFREPMPRRQQGQGSGVIVSANGYIITNNHVIAGAVDVEVLLADRRQFQGRVVATDPKTDVAVVKIEAEGLPVIPWGDSGTLTVGDFVLAIGNPLGLSQTVTFGIVSAVGRADVGVADYEDFIQTDAPINPGSSGGALVNTRGELIGINTAIASTTGGNVGVGFAIPSNMARAALHSLLKTGRVVRGFLGASTQDVSPLLRKLFHLPDVKGAIITDLMVQGSAEKAGIQRGDVIVRFDERDVLHAGQLRNLIAGSEIGSTHQLEIVRDGQSGAVELLIKEAPQERASLRPDAAGKERPVHPLGGILVDNVSFMVARQLGLKARQGVIVVDVEQGTLADMAGMFPGDLILEVNRTAVPNLPAYQGVANAMAPKEPVLLLINRQGAMLYVGIEGG